MNKKGRVCIFTCSALVLLLGFEILYLQREHTLRQTELAQKRAFVKMTTISNVDLALKNNYIKTLP